MLWASNEGQKNPSSVNLDYNNLNSSKDPRCQSPSTYSQHSHKSDKDTASLLHAQAQAAHKQKTTRRVTTVTKVIHEVNHIRPEALVAATSAATAADYIKMPLEDNRETRGVSIDYVTMPMGVHSRSQYINYNQIEQHTGAPIYMQENKQFQTHYQEYDNFPPGGGGGGGGHYPASSTFNVMQAVGVGNAGSYLSEYSSNERIGTPQTPNEHSSSTSPLPLNPAAGMSPSLAQSYLQTSQFDELADYHTSPLSVSKAENHYAEESALLYGYISTSNFGIPPNNMESNANPAAYPTRALMFGDNLTSSSSSAVHPRQRFGTEQELLKHMSQLTTNDATTSPRGGAAVDDRYVVDNNGEHCQAIRWRDPNLSEVISFLDNPNSSVKANAAAYLQHLCYMDDPNKQKTRTLGGIPALVRLLDHENLEVHKNACGALRNLSYGRQNDENKRAIKNAGGITALINLLCRTMESEIKELITGVIWNLSSCEDLKRSIIDDGLNVIVSCIIMPHSGCDPACTGEMFTSTVFRNASGALRNVSSAGEYARTKLRECKNLVECLLFVVKTSIEKNNIGNKIVENCVCILRNLSYRCQEVEDPNYDKHPTLMNKTASSIEVKAENFGCFGASKKKREYEYNTETNDSMKSSAENGGTSSLQNLPRSSGGAHRKGYEQLWQPDVVQYYLALLQSCSNPETLEAAAGAIQNLAACYWQPSIDIRAAVRKEKGLPILVELLRMEVDRVVCAVATALRNLALDQRNKELIGKYAMRDLVQKLPSGNAQHDQGTSDDTITAVLATINEVIKRNAEFARSLLDANGVDRLMNIVRQRQKYTSCVLKFASQVLYTMWQHNDLREVYKKQGWKEQDFVTKTVAARNAAPNSPNNANNTLNRPMASQSQTRYEDRTIGRNAHHNSMASRNMETVICENGEAANFNSGTMTYRKKNDQFYEHPDGSGGGIPNRLTHSDSVENNLQEPA